MYVYIYIFSQKNTPPSAKKSHINYHIQSIWKENHETSKRSMANHRSFLKTVKEMNLYTSKVPKRTYAYGYHLPEEEIVKKTIFE